MKQIKSISALIGLCIYVPLCYLNYLATLIFKCSFCLLICLLLFLPIYLLAVYLAIYVGIVTSTGTIQLTLKFSNVIIITLIQNIRK